MMKQTGHKGTTHGFSRASGLLQGRIRKVSAERGFAVTRLLTHWAEIVGEGVAAIATPVNVGYGRGGMGATLTLLTTGAQAPMLEMQKDQIRDKVNACYGYRAIVRVKITQTAPTGFAEGRVAFAPAPATENVPTPEARQTAATMSGDVASADLRQALALLGANILTKHSKNQR